MPNFLEYERPDDTEDQHLLTLTSSQGQEFNTYQQKIRKNGNQSPASELEGFSSLTNTVNDDPSGDTPPTSNMTKSTQLLTKSAYYKDSDADLKTQYLNPLKESVLTFKSDYADGVKGSLMSEIKSYVKGLQPFTTMQAAMQEGLTTQPTTVPNKALKPFGKPVARNVMVTSILDPTESQAALLDVFNKNPGLQGVSGDYAKCKDLAIKGRDKYFGLSNADTSPYCVVTNNLNDLTKKRVFIPGCKKSEDDGNMYGGPSRNAIYRAKDASYVGCYRDGNTRTMYFNGPHLDANILGKVGLDPWGGRDGFPDPNANWIWSTPKANKGAPNNMNSPSTFVYDYKYKGTNFINATIHVVVDDYGELYVNYKKVNQKTISNWWTVSKGGDSLKITIQPGNNFIYITAKNSGGPAGVLITCIDDASNQVLFNTGPGWKYTNEPMDTTMTPGSHTFSVKSCQKYANNNGYAFFGLQDGGSGTSQCFVSNNLDDAKKLGLDIGQKTMLDGTVYGLGNTMAVYQMANVGDPSLVGKVGYVNLQGKLSPYPASMVSNDLKTGVTKIINNGTGIPTGITDNVSSLQWQKYPPSGANVRPKKTVGGLAEYLHMDGFTTISEGLTTAEYQDITKQNVYKNGMKSDYNLKNKANSAYNGAIAPLTEHVKEVYKEVVLNQNEMSSLEESYIAALKGYSREQKLIPSLIGKMTDSATVALRENYTYILWTILAIIIVIVSVYIVKR
jgi:hypothetical protein